MFSQYPSFDQLLPVLSGRGCSLREWHQSQSLCHRQDHQGSSTWVFQTRRLWECWWVKPDQINVMFNNRCTKDVTLINLRSGKRLMIVQAGEFCSHLGFIWLLDGKAVWLLSTFNLSMSPSLLRYLCHGWYGPPVCEELWFSYAQCTWTGHSP